MIDFPGFAFWHAACKAPSKAGNCASFTPHGGRNMTLHELMRIATVLKRTQETIQQTLEELPPHIAAIENAIDKTLHAEVSFKTDKK